VANILGGIYRFGGPGYNPDFGLCVYCERFYRSHFSYLSGHIYHR